MSAEAAVAFEYSISLRGTRLNWGATAAMAFMASLKFLHWIRAMVESEDCEEVSIQATAEARVGFNIECEFWIVQMVC